MSLALDDPPRDHNRLLHQLRQMKEVIVQQNAALVSLQAYHDTVLAERDAAHAERELVCQERDAAQAEIEELRLLLRQLQREQFGRYTEMLDLDQRRGRSGAGGCPGEQRYSSRGHALRTGATRVPCRRTSRASRCWSASGTRAAPAAAKPAPDQRGHERHARRRSSPSANEGDPPPALLNMPNADEP
jgi:hypothetical protein